MRTVRVLAAIALFPCVGLPRLTTCRADSGGKKLV